MKTKNFIILLIILLLVSISVVSAAENENRTEISESVELLSASVSEDTIGESERKDVLGEKIWYVSSMPGDYPDFKTVLEDPDLKDGDTVYFSSGIYNGSRNVGLQINKKLTLNGPSSAVFDAEGKSRIFTVTANSINIKGLTFMNGNADAGGAIRFTEQISNFNIDSTFINNAATNGGAIFFSYIDHAPKPSSISGTYINNKAHANGGAIHFSNYVLHSRISGTYINNKAGANGGANYFDNPGGGDCIIEGTYINNTAIQNGGANHFVNDVGNVNGKYINNTASSGGANFISDNIYRPYTQNRIRYIGGTYDNNKANTGHGGANYLANQHMTYHISGTYSNNTAKQNGGANYFANTIKYNKNGVGGTYNNNNASYGGANYFAGTVSNNADVGGNYNNNNASYGGANYFNNVENSIIGGTFSNNNASYGGANYFAGTVSNNADVGGTYNNNTAKQNGGANYFNNVENSIIGGTFSNNNASSGGAIFASTVLNSIIKGTYTNNSANDDGGANRFWTVSNSTIKGTYVSNKAKSGGANCFTWVRNSNVGGTYLNNNASLYGGANNLFTDFSDSNLTGTYVSNKANFGGANWFRVVSNSTINGTYSRNKATYDGGANYFTPTVLNSTISGTYIDNTAKNGVNGFYGDVFNSIITGKYINNTASASSIIHFGHSIFDYELINVTICNSIFLNDKYNGRNGVIYAGKSGVVAKDNWFGNNATDYSIKPVTSNIQMDSWLFLNGSNIRNDIKFFLMSYGGTEASSYDNKLMPEVNLTITSTNGNVDKSIVKLDETIKFYPFEIGMSSATAQIENVAQTIEFKMGDFNLLQGLINKASQNSVINLNRNYSYNQYDTMTEGVLIDRNITINGNGFAIDAKGKTRIFNVTAGFINIINITLKNGKADNGGAIYFTNEISNSNVNAIYINNTATNGGANYFNSEVKASNINGTYANNKAVMVGGANYFDDSVSASNVSGLYANNEATGDGGANHFCSVSASNVSGIYTNNTAIWAGGANYFISVYASNVSGLYAFNKAMMVGGANYFINVSASNINGTYINNTAIKDGGANHFNGEVSALNISGIYINNTAHTIIHFKDAFNGGLDTWITNAIFLNNNCTNEIYAYSRGVVVKDCWFGNNASNFMNEPNNYNVQMNNWLFLNATADYASLLVMDSSNIAFKLNSTDGLNVFGFDNSKLPVVNLALASTKGDVEKTTTLDRTVKYVATERGKGSVTASIENAKHTIFLDNVGLNPEFSANVIPQEIDYGENTSIFLSYNDAATGTVNITLTGKKYSQTIENVDLNKTFGLPNTILPDEYEVTVTYSGDKVFANTSAISTLTANKLKSDIKVVGHDIYVNDTKGLIFTVTLPENVTGNLSISNGITLNITKEGRKENNLLIIEIMNNAYPVGKYEWTFTYNGDDIYESSKETSAANILIILTAITVNATSKLFVDDTAWISYNLTPYGAVGDIIFTSNDTSVVEVDQNGNIKAIAEGTALIIVTFEGSENYTASSTNITITVSKIPTEINITNATVELKAHQSIGDLATLNPAKAGNITYTSSNEDIVRVSDDGIIYARIKGTATVTVSFTGNNKYKAAENKTINVTVTLNDASVSVENNTLNLFVDDTFTIVANTTPKGLKVTYKPDNSGIIGVDNNGVVKALKEGNTTIIVSVGDNKVYAENTTTVTVTVSKIPTEILITNETLDLKVNDKVDSGAGLNPSEAGNLTYTISETSIIKLLDNQIIALSEGSATITYSFAGNDKYAAAQNKTITVKVSLNDASVRVNNNTLNLFVDDTFTIVATTVPRGLNVTYMPDNSGIISVDENGMVTALKEGTALIIVKVGGDGVYVENTTLVTVTVKKVNPTMNITADEITEGENATINIELPSDATGNVTTTINGKTYSSPVDNGKTIITIPDLEYGNYILPVTYSGDDKYNSLTKDVNLTVKEDEIIVSAPDLTKYYSGNERFTVNVAYANGRAIAGKDVKITINGVTYKRTTDVNGSASLSINLNSATYDVTTAVDNITVNSLVTILATIEAEDVESKSKNIVFSATFRDGEGNYLKEGTDVSFNIGGVIYNSQVTGDKGLASVDLVLNHGRFIITSFNSVSNENVSNSIAVDLKDADMILSGDKISVGDNATISVTLPDDATGNVTAAINGKTYISQVDNGKANIIIPDLASGNYTAHVTYSGDNNYNHATGNVSISVSKIDPIIDIEDDIITVGENATVTVILPNDATGNVRIGNEIVPLKNGTASAILTGLPVGITTIPVTYSGDNKYNPVESSADIVVNEKPAPEKKNLTIEATADEITEGEDAVIIVTGLENATGNVSAVVHGHVHSAPIVDGTARITVSGLAENATASVSYAGDDIYNPAVTHVNITVNKNVTAVISAENLTKYYKDSEKFTVKITDAKGQPAANKTVEIIINGVTYKRTTDENGTASLSINLNSGVYPVRVVVDGVEANFTVTVQSTIDSSDIVKIFRNGTQYNAIFTDAKGTPLPNIKVSFNLHGIIYNRTTDKNGAAKLNINLDAGDYIITAFNSATGEMKSNNIKVISLIESDDLTKYYRNATQFVVRIHTADGGYVGAGEEVKFNINGVIYTRTTNATGHAKLNINLGQGNYTITTYYKDCGRGNNIEVLPILTAEDLSMKYMDGSQFKAQLVDGKGNPYPKQTVTFNINGVFYNRVTDSDGQAKLNIRLMAGQYIITSGYNGCNISNKITISA